VSYRDRVPPCFDVYVWVEAADQAEVLSRFIDRYVDDDDPDDPRFGAFVRTFVTRQPLPEDREALAELRRDESSDAFSLYLRAPSHECAMITVTREGALVLGLSLDDPDNAPETVQAAAALMGVLRSEFDAVAGVGGVELAPAQSLAEWWDDALVLVRDPVH
jgi:hypothetical protein